MVLRPDVRRDGFAVVMVVVVASNEEVVFLREAGDKAGFDGFVEVVAFDASVFDP